MKKKIIIIALSILSLGYVNAKNVYADLSEDQAIGNGTWTAATQTFEWTANNNARMVFKGLSGDLTGYSSLVLETSDYTATYRVDFVCEEGIITGNGNTGSAFYSAGTKTIDLNKYFADHPEWMANVKEIRLNTNYSNAGTIKVSQVYLVQPMNSLSFDAHGVAIVDFADLMVSDASFDEISGVLVSGNGKGYLAISLPADGIDMTGCARMVVEYEGDDLIDNLEVANPEGQIVKAYSSKYKLNMAQYVAQTNHVNKFVWNINKVGKMTIKSIIFLNESAATGIRDMSVFQKQVGKTLYNLSGVRVAHPKGVVVSNGKKYIAK